MLPTINEFISKYGLENFVVVADSGLMNNANIPELEARGYKYIIGAKIKNESQEVKDWILEQPKRDCQMVEYDKGGGRRLLVGYTDDRAKKDAYNREREYAGWKRPTSMVHLQKAISTKEVTTSSYPWMVK